MTQSVNLRRPLLRARSFLADVISQRFRHDNISIILGSRTKALSIRLGIPSSSVAIANKKLLHHVSSREIIASGSLFALRAETNTIARNKDRQSTGRAQAEVSGRGWEGGREGGARKQRRKKRETEQGSEPETEAGSVWVGSWHSLSFRGKGKGTAAIHYRRRMTPREIYRLTASSN